MSIETELRGLREDIQRLLTQVESAPPRALTLDEAGKALAVSTNTIRRMIRDGKLLSVLIGKRPRIPLSEVQRITTPIEPRRAKVSPGGVRDGMRYNAKAEAAKLRRR